MPKTPNDERSIVKNPNSPAYKDAANNRSKQLNTKSDEYKGAKQKEQDATRRMAEPPLSPKPRP